MAYPAAYDQILASFANKPKNTSSSDYKASLYDRGDNRTSVVNNKGLTTGSYSYGPQGNYQPTPSPTLSGGGVMGAATGPSPLDAAARAAQEQQAAALASENSAFDYNRDALQQQLGSLGSQREMTLSSLASQLDSVRTQSGSNKERAQRDTESNIQDALSTAQDTERANRNKLRGLGILNSSAAGDILSQPLQAYDKVRAGANQWLSDRVADIDNFLSEKTAEHASAVRQIEQQYTDLVGKIQNDLRFNERQRIDAVRNANAALQQRMAEIQQAQFNFTSQAQALKTNLATQVAAQSSIQTPGFDPTSVTSTGLDVSPSNPNYQQASIYQEDQKKKPQTISGFLTA